MSKTIENPTGNDINVGPSWDDMSPAQRAEFSNQLRQPHAGLDGALKKRDAVDSEPEPILVKLSDVVPEEVCWLWPGRIARRKLTLIIGDPGLGKSALTLDISSRCTVGGPWPDGGNAPIGNTILLTCEDGLADTIRPRIDQFGGDPSRFYALQGIRLGDIEKPFSLATDLGMLERGIVQIGDVVNVLIDPLSAYLGTKSDSYKDSDIRGVLGPLAILADKHNVSVLGVMHLTKNSQQAVLYRAPGSIAFIAAARTVFAVAKDPDDENRRILAGIKSNLSAIPPSLGFQILLPSGGIQWAKEPLNVSADSLLSGANSSEERAERQDVEEFLNELLVNGQISANDVYKSARQNGFSEPTVKRAKRRLGIEAIHIGQPGEKGQWFWYLPKGIKEPAKGIKAEEVIPFEQTKDVKAINSIASPKGIKESQLIPFGDPLRSAREEDWL